MKAISITIFKRKPDVKNYIVRWEDDSVSVRTLWLVDKRIKGVKLLTKKFGKYLQESISQRFSKETLFLMNDLLKQAESPEGTIYQTVKLIKDESTKII